MAGLKGQVRLPNVNLDPRVRRNSVNLASVVSFISDSSVISIDGDGILQVDIASEGGLENVAGELSILLANDDLELSTTGLELGVGFRFKQQAAVKTGVHESAAFTQSRVNDLSAESRAIAFFEGQM